MAAEGLRRWALAVRRDLLALGLAARHPGVPLAAKLLAAAAVAYALSPIDLIPDFVPVLGQLDDLVLVPALAWLAVKLIPEEVMEALREDAGRRLEAPGRGRLIAAAVVVALWLAACVALARWLARLAQI